MVEPDNIASIIELAHQEDLATYCADSDIIAIAQEAVGAGIINQDVLDHLTSLHSEVPNSMKHRYLFRHIFKATKESEQLFMRMVQMLLQFQMSQGADTNFNRCNTPLSSEHISDLIEILAPHAYKWEFIGTALRFKPEDLRNIRANNALMDTLGVERNLFEMLGAWIEKKYRHTLPPTIENLDGALNSVIVGLGVLASEVRMNFAPKQATDHALPYYLVNVHFRTRTVCHIIYSKNITNGLKIEEGKSALLECQVTAETQEPICFKFQWLRNGKVITNSKEHSGTNTSTLCISNADIDINCSQYSCRVTPVVHGARHITTEPITLRVSCSLDKDTPILASLYLSKPEVPKDEWPPVSKNKYINLALIKQNKTTYGTDYARLTIRNDMDDILQQKEEIEYYKVRESLRSGHCLFIEGRPGCGKTTFVHKISQDWAASPFHRTIRLVLLVSLRVLNNLNKPKLHLSDILQLFEDLKINEKVLLARKGKGVCFIFDGFDEFSPSDGSNSIVHKIINKKCLKQSIVVVASRPAATAKLRDQADKVVEVLGFKKDQIHEYFDTYPFSCSPNTLEIENHKHCDPCPECRASKSLKLKSYLSHHPNIEHICYLPIHAFMVAFLFEVTGKVPHTEKDIYTHFTEFLISRNLKKTSETDLDGIDVLNLKGEEGRLFNQICKLALDKTISNKQVLHQDEVSSYFQSEKDRDISLGLITVDCTADQLYRFKNMYTFLHLSFQEYLAAYHISTLDNEEQMKLIQKHGHKNHMLAVWKFYCGLVEIKPHENKFKEILNRTKGNALFHIQCAYESQKIIACAQLLKSMNYHIQLDDKYLSTPDFTAIGYVINTSVLPTGISIINCNINREAIDALLSEVEDKAKHSLQALHYVSERIQSTDVACIVKLLTNFGSLKVLNIKSRKKSRAVQYPCQKCVTYSFTDIAELMIYNTNIIGPTSLLQNLKDFTKLKKLCLTNCIETLSDVKNLADGLKKCGKNCLKELDVSSNNMSKEGAELLANGLQHCRNLERVNIGDNDMTTYGVILILDSIRYCRLKIKSVEILSQKNCVITNGELFFILKDCVNLQALFTHLVASDDNRDLLNFSTYCKRWRNLKELQVILSKPYLIPTVDIVNSLQHIKLLEVFVLKHCIRDGEGAKSLADGLKCCPDLQVLDLSENKIGSIELEIITNSLADCTNLKELNLNSNDIGDDGAKIILLHVQHWNKLKILRLRDNRIYFDLATSLNDCTQLDILDLEEQRCERPHHPSLALLPVSGDKVEFLTDLNSCPYSV